MGTTSEKLRIIVDFNENGTVKGVRQIGTAIDKAGKKGKESFTGVGKSLDKMNKQTKTSIGLFGKLSAAVSLAGIGYSIKRIGEESISTSSDLEEVGSKFETVFKNQMDLANEWAKELQDDYAMSRRESKEYLASIQDLLVPMGMAADNAGRMSDEVVKLAADLGSFNNKLTSMVIDDYQSALVGNYETMKKYGVILNAAVVEQKALEMGLVKTKDELTASDKAMAAHQLIIQGSTAAIGDMKRTSDGYANTSKDLTATIEDMTSTMGNSLLPIATKVKRELNEWVEANEELIGQRVGEYVDKVVDALKDSIDWWDEHNEIIKTTAGVVTTVVIEYGKFWAIAKTISGGYALVTFFQSATVSIMAMVAGTKALSVAMKANLLAIGAYAGYKIGTGMTALATGTWGIDDQIKDERARTRRYKKRYQDEIDRIAAEEKAAKDEYEKTLLMEKRINAELEAGERLEEKAATDKLVAYKSLYEKLGEYGTEYYDILEAEIEAEKEAFIKAGVEKEDAQRYYLAQIDSLNEQFNKPNVERIARVIETAKLEKDALTGRLEEYRSFYGDLQSMIRENAALEKQHISELIALERQRSDLRLSTESMIRSLRETQMDPGDRYESQRTGLSKQYSAAMSLSGQEQIQALEAYKQAVNALASQYSEGIKSESSPYGMGGERYAVSSKQIIDDAIADIQRAATVQQKAMRDLETEKQHQIESDRVWGAELTKTARDVAGEIGYLERDIAELSTAIETMETTITMDADIRMAENAIRQLENEIESLRQRLRRNPLTIRMQVVPMGGESASVPVEGSKATGTRYIPKTGLYWLHQGEGVYNNTEYRQETRSSSVSIENLNVIIPESAAPQAPQDYREITRQYIIPELNNAGVLRG